MNNRLNDQLKELGEELQIDATHQQALKERILNQQPVPKRAKKKYGLAIAAMCLLFLLSPFYSSTMANLAAKILPLEIQPKSSQKDEISSYLTGQIMEIVKQEGYEVNGVASRPSPFTIEISVFLTNTRLKEVKEHLQPIIENFLYEKGIDDYKLKITEAEHPEDVSEIDTTYIERITQAHQIIRDVFTSFGYEEEGNYVQLSAEPNSSPILLNLNMPNHMKEQEDIILAIQKAFDAQNLDIQVNEVIMFNLKHHLQSTRWSVISSDLLDALLGKSRYQVTGLSYKVKKGHSNVTLKTDWEQPPTDEITNEITAAIHAYLQLPEIQEKIMNDPYTIQLLLKNKEPFITITNH